MTARGLLRATARNDVVLDVALRQLLERLGRQLLFPRRRTVARKLIQHARILGGDEHAEVLVGGVVRDLNGRKNSHDVSSWIDDPLRTRGAGSAPRRSGANQ